MLATRISYANLAESVEMQFAVVLSCASKKPSVRWNPWPVCGVIAGGGEYGGSGEY